MSNKKSVPSRDTNQNIKVYVRCRFVAYLNVFQFSMLLILIVGLQNETVFLFTK